VELHSRITVLGQHGAEAEPHRLGVVGLMRLRYGNLREFAEVRLGGRKGAYSGICGACPEQIEHRV
jgi:hypothetical protein